MRVYKIWSALLLLWGLTLAAGPVHAQSTGRTLPEDPAGFIAAFKEQVMKFGKKEDQEFFENFELRWQTSEYDAGDQSHIISSVNTMLEKNYKLLGEAIRFVEVFTEVKAGEAEGVGVGVSPYFTVADSMIASLDRRNFLRYVNFISLFTETGSAFQTRVAYWNFSQRNPDLTFVTEYNDELGKEFKFPVLTFNLTDLKYRTDRDSTLIRGTSGTLNILNKVFRAERGRIDWEKMGLDPSDVYADLQEYMLNLNYSFVNIDTVTFHYNSLLGGRELKGRFEDLNKGYSDINKANYPYFRSYDGGVTIENFIPNVRYEGGFSLRGVRKIGSAYYEWVEIPEEEVPEETPDEESYEDAAEDFYDDFDVSYDESAYYFSDDEVIDDGSDDIIWDEPDAETDGEDEFDGGFFDDVDPDMWNKELKLFKAQLTIMRHGNPAMTLRANEFILDLERLVGRRVEANIYLPTGDSISHPSRNVLFLVDSNEVVLTKGVNDRFARQPWTSPFHNYFLYFDAITWNLNSDSLSFTFLIDKENETSAIESRDYYTEMRWRQFKDLVPFHPMGAIHRYAAFHPGETITAQALLDEYQRDPDEMRALKPALLNLESSGFLQYNETTDEITPNQKLFDWALAARGKKDYDAIQITSRVESGNNAFLDLSNLDIRMHGVGFFNLSDSQFVKVIPKDQTVLVGRDRNLTFGGATGAGKLNFYGLSGEKFRFDYENYKIYCDSLDSLKFVLVRDPPLGYVFTPLQKALRNTVIEGVTGAIYVNKPNNKSGLETYPEYSVFDSYTNSYIYWAQKGVQGGVYRKDKLFFSIDPFVLDSLEIFNEMALEFEGEFYSSEILPRFRQKLVVMEDFTLGLKQVTPDSIGGFPTYDGKGKLSEGEVVLDGSGLRSKGKMEFLHTTAESDSFFMFFDSVKAVTKNFHSPAGTHDGANFPEIKAQEVQYKWLTKEDKIVLTSEPGLPITLFEGEGKFDGELIITPEGLKGSGTLTMGNVKVTSEDFVFREKDFQASGGTFQVADKSDPTKVLYRGDSLAIEYDVGKHTSSFRSEVVGKEPQQANSFFPQQQYRSSLGQGTYDRESNDMYLEALSLKEKDNYFYSTRKDQDSLSFKAKKAHYDFDERRIEVDEVPYIYVADAKITPDSGKVNIEPDGLVGRLADAVIEANVETKYHRMYDAGVEIKSAIAYEAEGKYDYISIGDKDQYIYLTNIEVRNKDTVTVAEGIIPEEDNFLLTERIFFRGTTKLTATDKFMYFDGEVKIDSDNEFFADSWFPYKGIVNPDSVFIPIPEEDMKKKNLFVGLHYIPRYRAFYSTFLQPKKDRTHDDNLLSSGGLTFDRSRKEFRIGPKDKLTGQVYRGATTSYNDSLNVITHQGRYTWPWNFAKSTMEVDIVGGIRDDLANKELSTDLVLGIKLDVVPKDAWSKLSEQFKTTSSLNGDINWGNYGLIESLAELLDPDPTGGEKATTDFVKNLNTSMIYTDIKVAKSLPYSLLLCGVKWKFDDKYKSFYSTGEVGIIGINGEPINKLSSVNTKIEYSLGRIKTTGSKDSDTLTVYLEAGENTWMYFRFYEDQMLTWSTDLEGYNQVLASAIQKRKKDEGYRFNLVSDYEKEQFLSRFIKRYIWKE